eukprot:6213870-Pleurochrysis_carterae.AAC.3
MLRFELQFRQFSIERAYPETLGYATDRAAYAYIHILLALEIRTHVTYQAPQTVDVARQVLVVQRDEIE